MFAGNVRTATIYVYRTSDGKCIGQINPPSTHNGGPYFTCGENDWAHGWIDMHLAVSARKRSNGEYIIFVEDCWGSKVIMYRWKPGGGPTAPAVKSENEKQQ